MLNTDIIAKNIIILRKKQGLTQQDLAKKIHYSDKVISKWERGDSVPDIIALYALSEFFGVSLEVITKEIYFDNMENLDVLADVSNKEYNNSLNLEDIIDQNDIKESSEVNFKNKEIEKDKTFNDRVHLNNKPQVFAKKHNRFKIIFITSISLVLAVLFFLILVVTISYCSSKSAYKIGSNITTYDAHFKVNSINYLSNIGGFQDNDDMLYVAIEIEMINRGLLDGRAINIKKEDFIYSNRLGTTSSHSFVFDSSRSPLFFNNFEEYLYGVTLEPTETRAGIILFATSIDSLKNQKLIYSERVNESKTKKYVVNLPDRINYK